jgi:hypothetical protein
MCTSVSTGLREEVCFTAVPSLSYSMGEESCWRHSKSSCRVFNSLPFAFGTVDHLSAIMTCCLLPSSKKLSGKLKAAVVSSKGPY